MKPPKIPDSVKKVAQLGNVIIYAAPDHSYICFVSDLDICNDGTGPKHGDKSYQPQTAYYNKGKFLNADVDQYIVIPPQIRKKCKLKMMGCQGRLTNLISGACEDAVTGEIGPSDKTGEAAYCLAKLVNPKITYNSGDRAEVYFYELWPGRAAVVNGKHYRLE
jgi:hypothetical protein